MQTVMAPINKVASFMLAGKMVEGEIVQENVKTIWVRVKDKIIKRHREKQQVVTA